MNKERSFAVNNLLNLLSKFIEGKLGVIDNKSRKDAFVTHYYNEIVRYWNRLNFILRRLINLGDTIKKGDFLTISKYLYLIFRYYEEKAPLKYISQEINIDNHDHSLIKKLKHFSIETALQKKNELEQLSLSLAYPTFLIRHLKPYMEIDFLIANLVQMNNYDPKTELFSFYLNDLGMNSEENLNQILKYLEDNRIKVIPDKDFSLLYYTPIKNKKKIILSNWYKNGNIIILDKASLIVANVVSPNTGELINDFCAAPGIKTNLLAQLTNNKSKIIANDFSYRRTIHMKKILHKLSAYSTYIINSDSIKLPIRFDKQFDRVLIDAPCTGSGTLLSKPELKWRQNHDFLKQNIILQTKLLDSGIKSLKYGGVLVYSTCSLYAEEGELQILKFLDKLEPMMLPKLVSQSYKINGQSLEGTGRLFPSIHYTKGFFIGKFKKKE